VKFNNDTIREAVQLWCSGRAIAIQQYGDINDWEVNQVTGLALGRGLPNGDLALLPTFLCAVTLSVTERIGPEQ
jgi:hypothetical protein